MQEGIQNPSARRKTRYGLPGEFTVHSSGNKGVPGQRHSDSHLPLSWAPGRIVRGTLAGTHFYLPGYRLSPQAMDPEHVRGVALTGAVITVSSSRTPDTDESGQVIKGLLREDGIEVTYYALVPDRMEHIRTALVLALDHANCVILTGGTGLTPDDCTIEAVRPFLEKEMEGFGEIFRAKSFQEIGTAAILSRALGGIAHGKAVFCLPGSVPAVSLATRDLILPSIRHILSHAAPDQR
jgi:molybdopterin adenylyltransferase